MTKSEKNARCLEMHDGDIRILMSVTERQNLNINELDKALDEQDREIRSLKRMFGGLVLLSGGLLLLLTRNSAKLREIQKAMSER